MKISPELFQYVRNVLLQTAETFRSRYKNVVSGTAYTTYLIAVRLIRLKGETGIAQFTQGKCAGNTDYIQFNATALEMREQG